MTEQRVVTSGVAKNGDNDRDMISQRNQKVSPLLCLPAELRNKVYDYVSNDWQILGDHCYEECGEFLEYKRWRATRCRRINSRTDNDWIRIKDSGLLALPSIFRQIYAEAHLLPFNSSNEFLLPLTHGLIDLNHRLNPEQRIRVINLRLRLRNSCDCYYRYPSRHELTCPTGTFESLTYFLRMNCYDGLESLVVELDSSDPMVLDDSRKVLDAGFKDNVLKVWEGALRWKEVEVTVVAGPWVNQWDRTRRKDRVFGDESREVSIYGNLNLTSSLSLTRLHRLAGIRFRYHG